MATSIGGLTLNNTQPTATPNADPGFLPGIAHIIAQPVGQAAALAGGVTGNGQLINLGNNILDPNVTLSNPSGVFQGNNRAFTGPGAYSYGAQSPSAPVKDASTTGTTGQPPAYTGNYYGAGYGQGSADYNAFQGLYDTEIGNMQNQLNALPAYQQAAVGNIELQYRPQANTLATQHASGLANLDLAQNQLDTQRSQGIRNLGNSLRAALNGYQNQIGVMGAGNSSAAPLIGYALSQQGNRQMADMNTNYNQQQSGVNLQRQDLEANYKNQMDTIDAWKQSNLNQIAQQYAQQQAQLQQQIMNSQGAEAQYLAMYGQTALANQTIQQMKALEQQYSDQVGQLNSKFSQVAAPVGDLSQYSGPYNIQNITPGQLQALNLQSNQDNSAAPTASGSLLRRPDQNQSNNGF